MDLERLLRDLPKYKPWLSAVAWEAWEEFCTATEQLSVSCLDQWELPKLVSDAIVATEARKGRPSATVSHETSQILDKESAAPTKVFFMRTNPKVHAYKHYTIPMSATELILSMKYNIMRKCEWVLDRTALKYPYTSTPLHILDSLSCNGK